MTALKPSLIAVSILMCFATQPQAANNIRHNVGNITINGQEHSVDISQNFTGTWGTPADTIEFTGAKDHVEGIYLGTVNGVSDKLTIDAKKATFTSSADAAIWAQSGAQLTVNADTVEINGSSYGIMALHSTSKVAVNAKKITINGNGIHVQSNTQEDPAAPNPASVNISADEIIINAGEKNGITAFSNGQANINGNLTINAKNVLDVRGNSTTNINTDGKHSTVLNGDIIFETPATQSNPANSGNILNAKVNINLTGKGSSWTGRAYQQYHDDNGVVVESNKLTATQFTGDVKDFNLTIADGATWNMTKDSFVNAVTTENGGTINVGKDVQSFNGDKLTINGGVINVEGDAELNVNTLLGTGGDVTLVATTDGSTITAGKLNITNTAQKDTTLNLGVDGITADDVKDRQSIMDSLLSHANANGATLNAKIDEGDIAGAIEQTQVGNQKGEITQAKNQKLDGYSSIYSLGAIQWRHETDSLLKRMGELRDANGDVGAWARLYGSEQVYGEQNVTAKNTTIQVGSDINLAQGWKVGGAFSYTDGSTDFTNGSGNNEMYGLAVYGTWFDDNGQFVDLIGKYARLSNEFTSGEMTGSYDNNAFSLSAEYGWHLALSNLAFVEPTVALTYGRILGDNFVSSNGVKVEQEDYDSLIGRIGLRSGFYFPNNKGTIYARIAVLHDFQGDAESTATKTVNGQLLTSTLKDELGGTWFEYGIGANFKLSDTAYTYVDLERTSTEEVKESYKWTAGVRFAF